MSERDHAMIVQDSSVSLIADFILVLFFVAVTHLSVLMCVRACLYSIERDEAEMPGTPRALEMTKSEIWLAEMTDRFQELAILLDKMIAKMRQLAAKHLHRDGADGGGGSVAEGLPPLLYWPNLEVVIVVFYAAGITESSVAVMGSVAAVHFKGSLAIAVLGWLFLVGFLLHDFARLVLFSRDHLESAWQPSNEIEYFEDMDDPLMRAMLKHRLLRHPALRIKGRFQPKWVSSASSAFNPVVDKKKTPIGRALRAPFSRFWKRPADDAYKSLAYSWLARVNGKRKPYIFYQMGSVLIQMLHGLMNGAAMYEPHDLCMALVALVIIMQISLAAGCLRFLPAADHLEGVAFSAETSVSALSLFVRFLLMCGVGDEVSMLEGAAGLSALAMAIAFCLPVYSTIRLLCVQNGILQRLMPQRKEANQARTPTPTGSKPRVEERRPSTWIRRSKVVPSEEENDTGADLSPESPSADKYKSKRRTPPRASATCSAATRKSAAAQVASPAASPAHRPAPALSVSLRERKLAERKVSITQRSSRRTQLGSDGAAEPPVLFDANPSEPTPAAATCLTATKGPARVLSPAAAPAPRSCAGPSRTDSPDCRRDPLAAAPAPSAPCHTTAPPQAGAGAQER